MVCADVLTQEEVAQAEVREHPSVSENTRQPPHYTLIHKTSQELFWQFVLDIPARMERECPGLLADEQGHVVERDNPATWGEW